MPIPDLEEERGVTYSTIKGKDRKRRHGMSEANSTWIEERG